VGLVGASAAAWQELGWWLDKSLSDGPRRSFSGSLAGASTTAGSWICMGVGHWVSLPWVRERRGSSDKISVIISNVQREVEQGLRESV
jgi:hypothetical protein